MWDIEGTLGEFERKSMFSELKEDTAGPFMMECEVALGVDS